MPVLTRPCTARSSPVEAGALGLPRRPLLADELVRADGRPVPVMLGQPERGRRRRPIGRERQGDGLLVPRRGPGLAAASGLRDFLESGPPPVFVGFGSMAGRDPAGRRIVLMP
ncbi:MAG: hypothetical protein WKF75_02000 [Singulisphaera sp.]